MEKLKDWLNRPDIKRYRNMPIGEYLSTSFLRDENRPLFYNANMLYAPADGVIVYAKENVEPDKRIVPIKGKDLTVQEILGMDDYKYNSVIVGIFMTVYDVHVNRMPSDGFIHYIQRDALKIENLSMRKIEAALLEGKIHNTDDMEYMLYNERQICEIYCPVLKQKYYIVQVADYEVDVIANFYPDGEFLTQGSPFAHVRYGSQIDLIVPILPKHKYTNLVKDYVMYHVEAGIDPVVEIELV